MSSHRSRSRDRSGSPSRRKHYDEPRDSRRDRRSPAPDGLLVRNISLSARPEDLRAPFERFGPVKDVYLPKNYHTGQPRGFGFVKFRNPEDAAVAKSRLDRAVIGGREIKVVFAEENRKTPQEMRRTTHTSSQRSHRRRSPSFSPRRRNHSYSRSPSPSRHYRRARDHGARDDYDSSRQSRSVSPRDERSNKYHEKSPRRPQSVSHEKKIHMPSRHSQSPRGNGRGRNVPSR